MGDDRFSKAAAAITTTVRTHQKIGLTRLPLLRPFNFRRTWLDLSAVFHGDLAFGLGCPAAKIDVVGSGIELDSFTYRNPLPFGAEPIRLITVGRLTRRKGFHTLIEALALLSRGGADCRLTLVGDGPEREALVRLAHERGVGEVVRFTGLQSHSQISSLLAESHIFVAPSETCPKGGADAPTNTIKEATAVGVPVAEPGSVEFPN